MKEHTWKLIESVAEHLAQAILLEYASVKRIDLTIEKPWAPVGLPLKTVSVCITREWHTAYIALGSNMGDKKAYLDMAVRRLEEMCIRDRLSACLLIKKMFRQNSRIRL